MKSLFSVNVKTNEVSGQEFILRKTDSEISKKSDEASDTLAAYQQASGVPLWFTIIKSIAWLAAMCLFIFFAACLINGFEITYQRAAVIMYIGVAGFVVWLIMFIIEKKRFKRVSEDPEVDVFISGMGELSNKVRDNLKVPANCADIDVFSHPYKLKNGKEKHGNAFINYFNLSMWVFKEGEYLCFADISSVYGIPISSITDIVLKKKLSIIPQWNKEESYKSERYKKFVKVNGYGMYFVNRHYSVQFTHQGEEWEILIPAYDIDLISELTGKYPTAL